MKVFQLNSVCGTGSTGRIAVDIANELKKHGHECIIAYAGGSSKAIGWEETYKISGRIRIKLHELYTKLTDKQGLFNAWDTRKLIKKIKQENPDIIHLHNIHGYYLNYPVLFKYLNKTDKKVIWTLHDCWAFTGHCSYFTFVDCDRWKTQCYKCPQKNKYPASRFLDGSKKNYIYKKKYFTSMQQNNLILVTPSKWLKNLVKESFLNKYSVQVINNGIDTNIFKPCKSDFKNKNNLENKKIVLGVASPWSERKGYSDFFKLAELLPEDYKIVMVGLTEEQLKTIPKKIFGIKNTNNVQELVDLYSAANVFINATYEDNYPTTNLEALACGTPVITYNTGGSIESVDSKYVCEQGNLEMLIVMIKKVCEEGKHKADNFDFSKEIMMKQYMELYRKLIYQEK